MKTVIYGLGEAFDEYTVSKDFSLDNVVALVDKNEKVIGKTIFGYTVISPQELITMNFDKILVRKLQ